MDTVVAIPRDFACDVRESVFSKNNTFVVMFATFGILSIFFVMVMSLKMIYAWCWMKLEHVVINLRRRHHTSRIVMGCDLNVAPNLEGLTGSRIHPNANSAPARWREAVTEWMHSFRLRAACTFDYANTGWRNGWDYEEKRTHQNSNYN